MGYGGLLLRLTRTDLLVAGDKSGESQKRFYKHLMEKADQRFESHLVRLRKLRKDGDDT
jgi:hypothetical protein